MSLSVRPVDFFTLTVPGEAENAFHLLGLLAAHGVNLVAFNAIPVGLQATQLVLFPEDTDRLCAVARDHRMDLAGPDRALFVQGDDELGALARIHKQLALAAVHPYASSGLTDGHGGFGYVVYLRQSQFEAATRALGV